ncbi:MAG: HAMP domain-containing histidine kinase [Marinilabiliaceae bacterium]|nr:HAMP domain-containing histidine kinase [Marinilabiliaceae bacterium]
MKKSWEEDRNKIIGMGDNSFKKSYYPELQNKIKELEAANQNLNTIFNCTTDCFVIHDIEGQILMSNKQCKKLFENCTQLNETNNILEIINKSISTSNINNIWNYVLHGNTEILQLAFKQKGNKNKIFIECSLSKIIWYDKTAILEVMRDITNQVYYEFELKQAKEKAEESDRLKTAFLANLSHEIRTPMNGILGFTDLLSHVDGLQDEAKAYITIIQNNSERLLNLIGELIDISKIESGVMTLNLEPVNLAELLNKLYVIFNNQAISKKIDIVLSNEIDYYNYSVLIDKVKIEQILTNLINNALKFTFKGHINIGCKTKNNKLIFWVKDTGIGISKESIKLVFNRFYQVKNSVTEPGDGSGLGLAITKALVELMNGEIWVESEIGKGSVFWFSIPHITE